MGRYDEIINLQRPKSKRPSMTVADRAKIFMPFAALKGYEDAIEEQQKLMSVRMELTEEEKEMLDSKIRILRELLDAGQQKEVTVKYFVADEKASAEEGRELGRYMEITGTVTKIDDVFKQIRIGDIRIDVEDVLEINEM